MHQYKTLNVQPKASLSKTFKRNPSRRNSEKITVITRDSIRTLKPHSQETIAKQQEVVPAPRGRRKTPFEEHDNGSLGNANRQLARSSHALKLSLSEFDNAKSLSVFLSKAELEARNSEFNNAKLKTVEDAKKRRQKMEEFDHNRSANAKLSELEQETKDKANYLLSKANMQLEEQEDDIKHLNELMLYAKCVAIRDVQVEEKDMIKQERKSEETRLDAMMEADRIAELKKVEEREMRRIEEQRKGASKIRVQIEERREAALLEQERRDQETKQILQKIADMHEQDRQEKLAKVEKSRVLMLEVAKANQESMDRRKQQKLNDELEDRKVLQYILDKEAREVQKDQENAHKKSEREQELARLRAAQEKISDKQAQQDALRAQRAHEAYEREWRRKEKEAAEKQKKLEQDIREERKKQQESREHAIAQEAHKMKIEFFENIKKQKGIEEKIKEEERVRMEKNREYSKQVKAQIAEKEEEKSRAREEFFMEGIRLAKERREKASKIEQIKARKIKELRDMGVPSKYCNEIERQTYDKEAMRAAVNKRKQLQQEGLAA